MSSVTSQPLAPSLPDRLSQRLASLGLTVAVVHDDGIAAAAGDARPVERLILESPVFAAGARRQWDRLCSNADLVTQVWPGLWLVPLPTQRRRRPGRNAQVPRELPVAVVLGPALLESDQLRAVCDGAHVDFNATVAAVDTRHLVSDDEAHRLAATVAWMQQDAVEIDRRCGELQTLSTQLGESYEELSLLYRMSTSMTVNQPPAHFLTEACLELQQTVGLRWIGLLLTEDDSRLNELAGELFTAGPVGCDASLLRRIGRLLMSALPSVGTPVVVDDTRSLKVPYLDRIAGQMLVVWLMREDKPLGIIFGADKIDGSHISSVDSKLCNSLANSLTIFLENTMLYEDVQGMFMGTLHALTASIDAKDRYTRGHSERVALLSRQLASAAGLDDQVAERVYLAGLVHDVGKIGVPEAVLCKTGRLDSAEFDLIRQHPSIGARILQDIRQMQDLIPGVLNHHERWDGRGYPDGLAGTDIPLFGRLICLADSFDAMCSNRTYRSGLTREQALSEIERCAGSQFDPELARTFVSMDLQPFFRMIDRHLAESRGEEPPGGAGAREPRP